MSATMPGLDLENFTIISDDKFYHIKKNRYKLILDEDIKNIDDLANKINTQTISTLCVVNTVSKAQILYKKLKKDENLYILTTHQTPKHRTEILQEIREKLNENLCVKLISTQLIEAGVDLDFRVGFREFSPLASVIQMAGRVNRNGKENISFVYVFNFLELDNVDKRLPYHNVDLQEEFIKASLKNSINEIEIFEILEKYFILRKEETNHTKISQSMEKLEFQEIYDKFNKYFMPKQPWKVSVFVEDKMDEFKNFLKERDDILNLFPNKFEAIPKIKEKEKELSSQIININENMVESLGLKQMFGMYILNFDSKNYTKEFGLTLDLTIKEETFT